jgi:hypothetical protein
MALVSAIGIDDVIRIMRPAIPAAGNTCIAELTLIYPENFSGGYGDLLSQYAVRAKGRSGNTEAKLKLDLSGLSIENIPWHNRQLFVDFIYDKINEAVNQLIPALDSILIMRGEINESYRQ